MIDHIQGHTVHARRGGLKNSFRYGVDYLLLDPEARRLPFLLSRNRFNLWSVEDRNHGGSRGHGAGAAWFRAMLELHGAPADMKILLLTQPSFLWFHFNPVSFWIALRDDRPAAFVAEVNSTFGQRHCYFCAHPGFRPIEPGDRITAEKRMHVSPFQTVAGTYSFRFSLKDDAVDIRISYANGAEGVFATLAGRRRPATNRSLAWAALRRPFGGLRVLVLIHWQALILCLKRAPFLKKQRPPETLVSDSYRLEAGE
ncbi:DUF1365 domain-containing protein [Pseudoruegeria sp. HB172150]|uniref:DUF1365 domain-containing protein n=1 Tax=Pseudoruegeria sp. HB172150 TaxID=2721164 RepID=UPI0015548A0B|nr:DUF1365 domain-containing protein [Pseudoruegeria sp. HB172150]